MHALEEVNQMNLLWSTNEVNVYWNGHNKTIDAPAGEACYLGNSGHANIVGKLVCVSSLNGAALWINTIGEEINVTTEGVFVNFTKPTYVRKYDLQTGDVIWTTNLSVGGATYLYTLHDQVQVLILPEVFWVLDQDGNVIRKEAGRKIFASLYGVTFVELNGLKAFQTETNSMLWEYVDSRLGEMPAFTEKRIFLRDGGLEGDAKALDLKTGRLLWTTTNIISNVVYTPGKGQVYALRENGDLLEIDEDSGKENVIVKFALPFQLAQPQISAYELAYDKENQILIVCLGDSKQLFAFQEK